LLIDRNRAIEGHLERRNDLSEAERSELQRVFERNNVRVRLLTPLAKYLCTESADWISRAAIQVHGGIGFMAESTVGKLHNDAIITTIYEGTSEIQVSFALKNSTVRDQASSAEAAS
jgi:alkylation response protein AidB-like acyl-CoA dehydrogenase